MPYPDPWCSPSKPSWPHDNRGGNLLISLAASNTAGAKVNWDDVTISTVDPANPTPTWGQTFGYDGFGNLLSETATAASAPLLNIVVDAATNRVNATGVQYDPAGNMTNDGMQSYTFDEVNRIKTVGQYSYTYSGLENKRIVVYNNTNASAPVATFNLYGPDGKRLGYYAFQGSDAAWTAATSVNFFNYQYLGNKPLNYVTDRVGSNRGGTAYYPYGNPYGNANAGAKTPSFGTYVQDTGSGLMDADQRYYHPGFGRFLTPDRSNANIDRGNPISWNRYAYTNGDPVNGMDPSGQQEKDTSDSCGPDDYLCIFGGYTPPGGGNSGNVFDKFFKSVQFIANYFSPSNGASSSLGDNSNSDLLGSIQK